MSAQPQLKITPQDYLKFERQATEKHEFVDGIIYAMSGASRQHNRITVNFATYLSNQFKERDCEAFVSDMRVKVNKSDYVYPDVIAVCGEVEFEDNHFDTLLNPTVIIEVLSKSTAKYDKSKKMTLYQNLPSVQDYILVAQDECRIEHYQRQNNWDLTLLTELEQVLNLQSVEAKILARDIYDKVIF
jgi:Uma2 family endonuclease